VQARATLTLSWAILKPELVSQISVQITDHLSDFCIKQLALLHPLTSWCNSSLEANSSPAIQESSYILWNPNIHYDVPHHLCLSRAT
jgi:hypothetical protein